MKKLLILIACLAWVPMSLAADRVEFACETTAIATDMYGFGPISVAVVLQDDGNRVARVTGSSGNFLAQLLMKRMSYGTGYAYLWNIQVGQDPAASLVLSLQSGSTRSIAQLGGNRGFSQFYVSCPTFQNLRNADIADSNGQGVASFYRDFLEREPDQGGLAFWTSHVSQLQAQGMSPVEARGYLALGFVYSGEFIRLMNSRCVIYDPSVGCRFDYDVVGNHRDFVTALYFKLLRRAPDAGGLEFWTGLLERGILSRAGVVTGFLGSGEYAQMAIR
jgi:hypothetical protein